MTNNCNKFNQIKEALIARNYILDPSETIYRGVESYKYSYICNRGHQRKSIGKSILAHGCLICSRQRLNSRKNKYKKWTIDDMQQIAAKYGGKCLSTAYESKRKKLSWKCEKGHIWSALPAGIIYNNSWCSICSRGNTTIQKMREIAAKNNGICLSLKYVGMFHKLQWKCSNDHIWEAKPLDILVKHKWCPQCSDCSPAPLENMNIHNNNSKESDLVSDIDISDYLV